MRLQQLAQPGYWGMWVSGQGPQEGRSWDEKAAKNAADDIRPEGRVLPWLLGLHDLVSLLVELD